MNQSDNNTTEQTEDGRNPRASHWFDFNRINDTPSEWTFDVIKWDDNPDAEGVVDCGEAEVIRDGHRFIVTTWLQPRKNTYDRYWSVAYETIDECGEPEPLSFHIGTSQTIAANNIGHARDVLNSGKTEPHVVVRNHSDAPRESFEFPTAHMAEKAADLQLELKLNDESRNYHINVYAKDEWEERLEDEESFQSGTEHERQE